MKLGMSVCPDDLPRFPEFLASAKQLPTHLQLINMQAEPLKNAENICKSVQDIRGRNPQCTFSIHAYKYNFTEKVPRVLNIWIELAKETIQFAEIIRAEFVNFHLGLGSGGTRIKHESYRKALIPVLLELVKEGEKCGVEIHIENLYPRPVHSEMRMLGDRAADFELFFREIDSPFLKLCYDYGHGNIDEHGIDILRKFSHKLGSIHAHDNDQIGDRHEPVFGTRTGTICWESELEYLRSISFPGPFILESSIENQIASANNLFEKGYKTWQL